MDQNATLFAKRAPFAQTPFTRGANVNLCTDLRQLFDRLSASNALTPDRDYYTLLMMGAKFADAASKQFDRAYLTAMKSFPDHRIHVLFEILLAAYTDPGMSKLLKENKKQTLLVWKADTPITVIRESILSLMHEWQQDVEDTVDVEGLQITAPVAQSDTSSVSGHHRTYSGAG